MHDCHLWNNAESLRFYPRCKRVCMVGIGSTDMVTCNMQLMLQIAGCRLKEFGDVEFLFYKIAVIMIQSGFNAFTLQPFPSKKSRNPSRQKLMISAY